MNKKSIGAALALLPSIAFAHPGHGSGLIAAFVHPFTGIDHLLMMLCVGIFAGRAGGSARWQLPLAFLSAMTVGWLLGCAGAAFAGIESGIAAGLIALGVLFVWQIDISRRAQIAVIAGFALLHGMAHGIELTGATPFATGVGFLAATALLHAAGLIVAASLPRERRNIYRVLGAVLSIIGGGLLATI